MTRKPNAFTLIELLAVLMIMAIAASVTLPLIWISSSGVRLGAAVQNVVADLQYAQSQAVTTQKEAYVVFSPGTKSKADQYELQSPLGTVIRRPGGAGGTVTMGQAKTQLPGARLGLAKALTLGFDPGGQPFSPSGSTEIPLITVQQIPLSNLTGSTTETVNVQPFTGEITVQ